MHLAFIHRTLWPFRVKPKLLLRNSRRMRRGTRRRTDRQRYLWETLIVLLAMLIGCALGMFVHID
jgi:hypothetical protein